MVSIGLLPLFSLKVSYVRPKADMVNLPGGQTQGSPHTLGNPPSDGSYYTFVVSWAVVSGLDIWSTTWKISEWQIKDILLRAMIMAHSLNRAKRIEYMISSIPPSSLPLPPGFIITPHMETQIYS